MLKFKTGFYVLAVTLASAMVLGTATISDAVAFNASGEKFIGLWEGIDPDDGSTVQVSISDINNDGVLEIVAREGFFTVCRNLGTNYSLGRGTITGTGTVMSKSELWVDRTRICINDDNTPIDPPFDSSVKYTLESKGKVLNIGFTVLHRTSE
jgi:hypothetical protein